MLISLFSYILILISFIIKFIIKLISFVFSKAILRIFFILSILGYFFKIDLGILSTIYFFYLTHRLALKLKIYEKIMINFKLHNNKVINRYKIYTNLKKINSDSITFNNLSIIDYESNHCTIDNLAIISGKIFLIKPLSYSSIEFVNKNLHSKIYSDNVLAKKELNPILDNISNYNHILTTILPADIPIINVIALCDNTVIKYEENFKVPIITINNLSKFIERNINDNSSYTLSEIKDIITENKIWIIDSFLYSFSTFLYNNKVIISFLIIDLFVYYIYINLILIFIV